MGGADGLHVQRVTRERVDEKGSYATQTYICSPSSDKKHRLDYPQNDGRPSAFTQ